MSIKSEKHILKNPSEAIEYCYQMGWSDGLPVIPPTEEKVQEFLEYVNSSPSEVILVEPVTGRVVTAEKAAVNAIMAGCLPEYFPVVLAALQGMSEPDFNLHGATLQTGGTAVMAIVNGPIVKKIGLNSGTALFCPGNRANSTIGRALHLVLWNCTGNRPDQLDMTIMGHAGRYSMCIAEREEALPTQWNPLHVERGFAKDSSTVTVFTALNPLQTGYAGSSDPKEILINLADTILSLNPWHRELLMVVAPEILNHFNDAGWSKEDVSNFIFKEARKPAQDFRRAHKFRYAYQDHQAKENTMISILESPSALQIVAGGGEGGTFITVVSPYGIGIYSKSITRKITTD